MYLSRLSRFIIVVIICTANFSGGTQQDEIDFKLGNEVLLDEYIAEFQNQTVAVLTNQTGMLSDGAHFIDELLSRKVNVAKIFTPEHGVRGNEVYSDFDEKTGIPIVSLYGGKYRPDKNDLEGIDVLIYDVQDVGARFYTYTSTLYYLIESAVENNKKLYVCDRPMMINPNYVDGFMLEEAYSSFVGLIPAPVCYGMTCGELAGFIAGEVQNSKDLIRVIKMKGYDRETEFDSLQLFWSKPSPNMFTSRTAACYPATCFLEGTNVSEGRGTEKPFEYFGAPWVDAELLSNELNSIGLPGVSFKPVAFTPIEKISNYPPKYFNKQCNGVFINVKDKKKFEPVKCGVAILAALKKLFKEFKFDGKNFIDKLAGTDKLRVMISSGKSFGEIVASWKAGLDAFRELREKYLLY